MINPKLIVGSAMVGFFLSCFAGFLSGAGLLVILLRALIFAVIFSVLGCGLHIVSVKFLNFTVSEEVIQTPTTERKPVEKLRTSGNVVDITIQDEDLPRNEQEPEFVVSRNIRMPHGNSDFTKSPEKVSSKVVDDDSVLQSNVTGKVPDSAEFVPLNFEQTAEKANVKSFEETPSEAKPFVETSNVQSFENDSASDDSARIQESENISTPKDNSSGLDDLPDLTDLVEADTQDDGDVIDDSEFASSGEEPAHYVSTEKQQSNIKDSELIARAIRTAIANDD